MASTIRHALEKLRNFRCHLMEKLDFAHKKKNQPKLSVELHAIAVRNTSAPCEEGMYCIVKYGDKKRKTRTLANGDVPDWMDPISLSSYSSNGLVIECWHKKRKRFSRKCLGKVSISQAEINDAPNGTIKTWFSLATKKNANSAGRIYISLRNPAKYVEQPQPPAVVQKVATTQPSAEPNTCVVDRLFELRPELKNAVVKDGPVPDEFRQKMASVERVISTIDNQLKSLEQKLTILERRGMNLFIKQEVERLMQDLDDIIAIGTKRLHQMGQELNAVHDEDLHQKMQTFNETFSKLMSRVDEYQAVTQEIKRLDLLGTK
jgi:exonuclease VII small subunit